MEDRPLCPHGHIPGACDKCGRVMDNQNPHLGVCLADELSNKDDQIESLRTSLAARDEQIRELEKDRERNKFLLDTVQRFCDKYPVREHGTVTEMALLISNTLRHRGSKALRKVLDEAMIAAAMKSDPSVEIGERREVP